MSKLRFHAAIFISILMTMISYSVANENMGSQCVFNVNRAPCGSSCVIDTSEFSLNCSSPKINLISHNCNPIARGNYTHNSSFESNLLTVFSNLTFAAASSKAFHNTSFGSGEDKVFGLFYCRGDVGPPDCVRCVEAGISYLKKCTSRDGLAYYEQCTIRYATHDMFNEIELKREYDTCWLYKDGPFAANATVFNRTLETLMLDLIHNVTLSGNSSSYFATKSTEVYMGQKIYALAQCRPDLVSSNCEDCLSAELNIFYDCLGLRKMWNMYFHPSCQMRYDVIPFFNLTAHMPPPAGVMNPPNLAKSQGRNSAGLWSTMALAIILIILLSPFNIVH